MKTGEEDLIRGLWPLPGGNRHYLDTLNQMLKWVASQDRVDQHDLIGWSISRYNVSESSANGYARVVFTLGALSLQDDLVTITPLGAEIMDAEGEEKARAVTKRFMEDYLGFREVLEIYERADKAIHLNEMVERLKPYFPRWTSEAQYEYRALWLLSLGALEQTTGRHYGITDFGRQLASEYPPVRDIDTPPAVDEAPPRFDDEATPEAAIVEKKHVVDALEKELREAAMDSRNPDRMELVVAECFEYLGFTVDHLGGSGETDVLVSADIGNKSYIVVVDAKSRGHGRVNDLNVITLLDHKNQNKAQYAVVVGAAFAEGRVARHAADQGVVLMNVDVLARWLHLHTSTPLNLDAYRGMFATPGLLKDIPPTIDVAVDSAVRWGQLLVDLVELIQETYGKHGLEETLPREQLFFMLMTRLGGVRYSKEIVSIGVDLLAHPAIGAIIEEKQGVNLTMNRRALAHVLRSMANRIESLETETQE